MVKVDRAKFFALFRPWYKKLRGTSLPQETVEGLSYVLNCIEADAGWTNVYQVANFLAQTGHESAWKWKPIREFRGKPGTRIRKIQDRYWGTGYYGRGLIQITWLRNYKLFATILGVDLVRSPDLALDPKISYLIASIGMRRGSFTGKKLSDYITNTKQDYVNARRVVNGTDKAATIAGYSKAFETMLLKSAISASTPSRLVDLTGSSQPIMQPEDLPDVDILDIDTIEIPEVEDNSLDSSEEADARVPGGVDSEPETGTPGTAGELAPVDNYPENPKPGEPTPDNTAAAGEPVTGGRPTDESTDVTIVEATKPKGWQLWQTTVVGWVSTLGISGTTIGTYLIGAVQEPTTGRVLIIVGISAAVLALFIGVLYLIIRAILLVRREKMAHELTLKEMEIRSNPTLYNVQSVTAVKPIEVKEHNSLVSFFRRS